jgi:zinc finger SWIM domain-containing protein 3
MLDIGERCVLDNESNEQEPAHGSQGKENTSSRQNMRIAEVPKIGIKFDCDNSAYEFYKEYAHRIGFSVGKHLVKRANSGLVKRRTFCCSNEGKRVVDKRRKEVFFHHPISRVGCLAQMTSQLQKDGMLEIVSFHEQHNHEFASSPMKHM